MKKPIVIMAALALSVAVQAQPLNDGIKMYQYERYQTAESLLSPAAATNATANYYYGLSQLGAGHIDSAKATFSKYPEDPANMAGMARIAFLQNQPTQGAQIAATVAGKAKRKEWEPLKYAADALTYTTGGDLQQAVAWYKKALTYAEDPSIHIALGDAYQKIAGGGGEAMNNYEAVTGKDNKNSLAFSRIGALWYDAKNYKLALDNYKKAQIADPTNPLPYRDLANAYYWVSRYDSALFYDQKYLQYSDKSTDDEIQYLDILYLSKNYNEAITQAKQLINSGVKKPGFYGILSYSELETGDSSDALNDVKTYFQMQDPKKIYPNDYLNYGKIYMKMKNSDSASYYFNKALAVDTAKDKSDNIRKIAQGFFDMRDWAKAGEWYGKLVAANPNTQAIDYYYWGYAHFRNNNLPEAAKAFEAFEKKYPDQPSATYWRARTAAAMDPEAKSDTSLPLFNKWLSIPDTGGYVKKGPDLLIAYEWIALYYFNKKDYQSMNPYLDKILTIDPKNNMVGQIKDAMKKPAATTKTSSSKSTTKKAK